MTRAADKLISQITQDITSGVLQPGDQLKESFLAEKFGVSRTPIREAIRAMVRLGLLEAIPRKGVKVRILNTKELLDLFEVAAGLEGMASRLAAYSLTDEHAKVILSKLENCKVAAENEDKVQYSIANIEFHAAIHEATNNRWLIEQLQHIGIHINTYRSLPYNVRERLSKSTEEHEAICKAILAGEGSTASQLMRDHMMLQGQRLPSVLNFSQNK